MRDDISEKDNLTMKTESTTPRILPAVDKSSDVTNVRLPFYLRFVSTTLIGLNVQHVSSSGFRLSSLPLNLLLYSLSYRPSQKATKVKDHKLG